MTEKRLLHYGIIFTSWTSLLMLSIGLALFVQDIWIDYQEEKTNDRVYSKSMKYFRHPTIAICFEPQINKTKLKQKYNKSLKDLNVETYGKGMLDTKVSVPTLLDDVSFRLGRDFSLALMLSDHESSNNRYLFPIINSTLVPEEFSMVKVEEIPSVHYGTCTAIRVLDKVKGSIKLVNFIKLFFKTIDEDEIPLVNVFFTSEENFHGAAWRQWFEGDVYVLPVDPKQKLDYAVNLKPQIKKRLKETSFCSQDMIYYKCMARRYAFVIQFLSALLFSIQIVFINN